MDKTIIKNEIDNIFSMSSSMDAAVAEEDWDTVYGLALDMAMALTVIEEEVESAIL